VRGKSRIRSLLVAEGDHGEDAGGPPCGDVAGEERDDSEQEDDGGEGEPVRNADAVEQAAQETREEERGDESDRGRRRW
jgi:hypothetical protein